MMENILTLIKCGFCRRRVENDKKSSRHEYGKILGYSTYIERTLLIAKKYFI